MSCMIGFVCQAEQFKCISQFHGKPQCPIGCIVENVWSATAGILSPSVNQCARMLSLLSLRNATLRHEHRRMYKACGEVNLTGCLQLPYKPIPVSLDWKHTHTHVHTTTINNRRRK